MFSSDIKARQTLEVVPVSQLPFCRVAEPNPKQGLWFWSSVRDSFRGPCIISNGQSPKLYLAWSETAVLNVLQRPSGQLVVSQLWNVAVHIKVLVTGIGGDACKIDQSENTATRHAQDHLDRLLNVLTAARKPGRFGRKKKNRKLCPQINSQGNSEIISELCSYSVKLNSYITASIRRALKSHSFRLNRI